MNNFGKSSRRGRSQGISKIFRAPIYRAHCAVVFEIAQLCYLIVLHNCIRRKLHSIHSNGFGYVQRTTDHIPGEYGSTAFDKQQQL